MPKALLTARVIERNDKHGKITVWNRGGLAGTLTVLAEDTSDVLALLEDRERLIKEYERDVMEAVVRVAERCGRPVMDVIVAALSTYDLRGDANFLDLFGVIRSVMDE
jgi:hypothetical protein